MSKGTMRLIRLLLVVGLLVSISYLALEISLYIEGRWRLVEPGAKPVQDNNSTVQITERETYANDYWDVVRKGELFFKPLPEKQVTIQQPVITPKTPTIKTPTVVEPPKKPTCPWLNRGVTIGQPSLAILTNKDTQQSEIVKIGSRLGEFSVVEITVNYVLVKSSEAEFKLEVGGQ